MKITRHVEVTTEVDLDAIDVKFVAMPLAESLIEDAVACLEFDLRSTKWEFEDRPEGQSAIDRLNYLRNQANLRFEAAIADHAARFLREK